MTGVREQGTENAEQIRARKNFVFSLPLLSVLCCLFTFLLSGCGPKYSYPAASAPAAVEKICLNENQLEVKASVHGKTIGAAYYVDDILDEKGQIPKEIHEKMGKIMQAVSRVALSTDLPLDFCVVNIRDRKSQNELVITRSVDDTRRAQSEAIGVMESINRTLFGQGKYQPSSEEQQNFDLKEVKLETFLADQIAQRIRFGFAKDPDPEADAAASQSLVLVDGNYVQNNNGKEFRFSVLSLKAGEANELMSQVFNTVSRVLVDYKYKDYDKVEILDYVNRQKLDVPRDIVEAFAAKKISMQLILDRYLSESQSIQEAFKLFGFNMVDSKDAESSGPPIVPAAP